MKVNKIISYIIVPVGLFLIALATYHLEIFNKLMFPNPIKIIDCLFLLLSDNETYSNILLTLSRVINGIIISVVIGVPLGILIGYFNYIYDMFEFIIDFFRSIPVTALFPLFLLFLGVGNLSKIILSAWIATLVIIVNTSYGVRHANKAHIKMAKVYNTSKKFIFTNVIFLGTLPNIFSGLRIGVSLVLIVIIVSEMFIGSVNGLGYAILDAQLAYRIPEMYAMIILTGILGYLLNRLLLFVENRTVHWTEDTLSFQAK